jgi:mRNA deadenylase 3'-5' endonuclease subunit Ccr4
MLRVVTFNILASIYAHPDYYPDEAHDALSLSNRQEKILNYLSQLKDNCEVIALQEVTSEFLQHVTKVLNPDFIGIFYPHDEEYWNEWIHSDYSYLSNGNMLFLKQSSFGLILWENISLKTGNHAVLAHTKHIPTGHEIRILNIHLDSDNQDKRLKEYETALNSLEANSEIIDIVLGDFNSGIVDDILEITSKHNFIPDNNKIYTFSMTKNPIDHVIYRSPYITSCITRVDNSNAEKFEECLTKYGSDHIPLKAFIRLQ